jgi:hypothetical protein
MVCFAQWRRVWPAAVVLFLLGRRVWNAWAKGMSAKRKMLAASSAEDCKHGAEDAPANLADSARHVGRRGNAGVRFSGGAGVPLRSLLTKVHA